MKTKSSSAAQRTKPSADGDTDSRQSGAVERVAWPIADWAQAVGISRASVFNLMAADRIKSVKFGSKRLITTPPREFVSTLEPKAEVA